MAQDAATGGPRPASRRKEDALRRLAEDVDAWVATADPATGAPHLIPLSFLWDGDSLLFATPAGSRTARNLQASPRVRVGVGPTRDVVVVEGTAEVLDAVAPALADAFSAHAGFDPREQDREYCWLRVRPERLQAWREADELAGRELMTGGEWLVG